MKTQFISGLILLFLWAGICFGQEPGRYGGSQHDYDEYFWQSYKIFPYSPPIYRFFPENKKQNFLYAFPGIMSPYGLIEYNIKPSPFAMIGIGIDWIEIYLSAEIDLFKIRSRRVWVQGRAGLGGKKSIALLHTIVKSHRSNLAVGFEFSNYPGTMGIKFVAAYPYTNMISINLTGNHRLNKIFFLTYSYGYNRAWLRYDPEQERYVDECDGLDSDLVWRVKDGSSVSLGLGIYF